MREKELKSFFTEEFFEEFQFDAEFRSLFLSMEQGLTPYNVIEHLCKSKKTLIDELNKAIENTPRKLIVTTEQFEDIKVQTLLDSTEWCERYSSFDERKKAIIKHLKNETK